MVIGMKDRKRETQGNEGEQKIVPYHEGCK